MWPHLLTPVRGFYTAQLNLWSWVDWTPFYNFAKTTTSLERWRSVVSALDVSRNFFHSRWASHSINQMCLLGWSFYNSKSSKPYGSASLFGRRNKRLLVTSSKLSIWPVQWLDFVLAKALVKTPYRLNALLMSPLNKAPGALIDNSGSCAFTLIPPRAHCILLCSSLQ